MALEFAATVGAATLVAAAQVALLPAMPAGGRMRFGHLASVLRVPVARTG